MTMLDKEKYFKMYQDILQLSSDDTMQLVLDANDEDQRDFFVSVENFLLRRGQRNAIREHKF